MLRDVHPAVWRWVRVVDRLSIADLHHVIQVLMALEDDHLHRFRIHGRNYGITYVGEPVFAEDAEAVPLSHFASRRPKAIWRPPADLALIRMSDYLASQPASGPAESLKSFGRRRRTKVVDERTRDEQVVYHCRSKVSRSAGRMALRYRPASPRSTLSNMRSLSMSLTLSAATSATRRPAP